MDVVAGWVGTCLQEMHPAVKEHIHAIAARIKARNIGDAHEACRGTMQGCIADVCIVAVAPRERRLTP
jgi:hypothetical protein